MSENTGTILFEHPLNEKMRTWLRLDYLLQQLYKNHSLHDEVSTLAFFRTISEFLDVLERGEVRTDLLKELERQQRKLSQWSEVPGVDTEMVSQLSQQLKESSASLMSAPRIGQSLRDDRLIALVRQRLSIPGGCCSFDLPTLHLWLHLPQDVRNQQSEEWLNSLTPLYQALALILQLIRNSAAFKPMTSLNGFYQENAEGANLLRLQLPLEAALYPQISGHKTRFAIRFLPLDSEHGTVPERLIFNLSCC
ncbi:cell division protein ZapD [Enterobacillus tribolii]|uniref:Cell division protein ZapD n=1 Tax=Enterobacillus tribolii TaxID=1487935 RepID=A0A370R1Q7_9GAMM|nr:cell division protein ZapD [Enterobacillus tribolii]MBW7983035.1 cell division protein ZapD [Enterobacillus tribolii]RDK95861.1 cell division protein ZapD [Enterobacillus tribolii]